LFKKDDPTWDYNALDRIKRWRAYYASYITVQPTENVDFANLSTPYLKSRFPKPDELDEDVVDKVKHHEATKIDINPATYTIKFQTSEPFGTGGDSYFVHPDKVRAGLTDEGAKPSWYQALRDSRRERFKERIIQNNSWMKDLDRDDVDARKAAFQRNLEEPKAALANGDDEDVEMAEA
jgi:paired amphipathic helix protein Sin3a